VRSFGFQGLGVGTLSTLQGTATSVSPSANYGSDLNNAPVTSATTFNSAVALLRSADGSGRNATSTRYVYPAAWSTVEANMATTDLSSASSELVGNPTATLAALQVFGGISTLAVNGLTCGLFAFASLDPASATYWGERWELYKHQYVLSGYAWTRGVTRIEYWNEPDLNANCINGSTWIEHVTLRSKAIHDAFADFNADVVAAIRTCPVGLTCPIYPSVVASAFASGNFGSTAVAASIPVGGPFAYQTYSAQHLLFPPSDNVSNASWFNAQIMSWHSYGEMPNAPATRSLLSPSVALLTPFRRGRSRFRQDGP